jgi:hypothetical protein
MEAVYVLLRMVRLASEVAVEKYDAATKLRAQRFRPLGGRCIAIQRDHGDVIRRLEQRAGVPTTSERAIEKPSASPGREECQDLAKQDGLVTGRHGRQEGRFTARVHRQSVLQS